jgi:nucleoside-diphosphate-sugar epimerase
MMSELKQVGDSIGDVEQLERLLSEPTDGVIETMRRLEGDLIVLGAAGKIGPTQTIMAKRASDAAGATRRVIAVSRFSNPDVRERLERAGVETIACDLMDRDALARLPDAPNVLYMPAMKFGSTGQEAMTWAVNTYLPGMVCERYSHSRIVAYSTGNVYALMPHDSGGSKESDKLDPKGDYAMSCVGRERLLTYFSERFSTPIAVIRLNYAHEMRYGVMTDVAQMLLAGQPVDVTMGYFNAIWQGDSNAMTLMAFDHAAVPARPINITGLKTLAVRDVARRFGELMNKPVEIVGTEAPDAFLSDATFSKELFGPPRVDVDQMIRWIADWQLHGGPMHGKPTHFQTRDGKF